MSSRDDGWGLRGSEGWYRYRHCRPITTRELLIPTRDKGFLGWLGDLEETRHTLAFIGDGRRFHLQGNWQAHEESIGANKERVIGYTCLDPELLGAEREHGDWANVDVIGYSWFKDDQFAATKDLPFFDAMKTGPPEVAFVGGLPSMKVSLDKQAPPPPAGWRPYLSRYARHRLGGADAPPPVDSPVDAVPTREDDTTGAKTRAG